MNATELLANFDRLAEVPNAVPRLRRFILDLAVRGKLVEQDAGDEAAAVLLEQVTSEWARLQNSGVGKKGKYVSDLAAEDGPFALPSLWAFVCLGEVLQMFNGRAFKPTEWLAKGLPIVRIQNLNNPNAGFNYCDPSTVDERHLIRDGEFLISWSGTPGTSFGAFIWQRGEGALNQHIFRCVQVGAAFEPRFLRLAINTQLDVLISQAQGGVGLQHVTKGTLEKLPLALPPLAEQHRIVAKVDELMALCDQLEVAQQERECRRARLAAASLQRLNQPATDTTPEAQRKHARFHLQNLPRLTTRPEHIKAMRQTILNLAVRGLLLSQDATNEPAAALLKEIESEKSQLLRLGAIPKNRTVAGKALLTFPIPALWQAVRLGDVCNLITSGSRGWAEFYAKSGPKFLRAQNIRFGRLRLNDLACVNPPAKSEGARTQVQAGDLLIVITGAGVTNPALLDRDLGEAYVSQHVALVRPSNVALSRWLLLCLMAGPSGRDELVERAYGAGKPGLNLDNIRSLNTPIPPLVEQHRIVAKVDELMALCDRLEAQLTTTQTDSHRLLEAVLEAAFAPI
jgi:type I restriction enzyme S subunit